MKRASSRGHELSTHQDEVQASTSLQQHYPPSQGNENEDRDNTSNENTSSDTATSTSTDGTDNTTNSTHVVRVKQEVTTTNDNTQQVRIKQEPMEDNDNTNNNNEDNDELVNSDEKASCALKVLLDLDVGSLTSAKLKEKIIKCKKFVIVMHRHYNNSFLQ